jgi:hypothetical protein
VWNDHNVCLSWDETKEWAELLGLHTCEEYYRGTFSKHAVHEAFQRYKDRHEGYIVRPVESFAYSQYKTQVGKFVRANHVHTHGHWMRQKVEPNEMKR